MRCYFFNFLRCYEKKNKQNGLIEEEVHPMILEYTTKKDNETIKLPLNGNSLNTEINWGDGSPVETVTRTYSTHEYVKSRVYETKISGTAPSTIGINLSTSERQCLTGIKNWGKLVGLISIQQTFNGCEKFERRITE